MKFAVVIFLAYLTHVSLAQDIDCVYSTTVVDNVEEYVCNLETNNPDGFDDFASIAGTHAAGRTDADVTYITNYHGSTSIVPRIICSQFPNLRYVLFVGFGITAIGDSAFAGCPSLRNIELFENHITQVSPGAFVNNRNVTFIDLGQNRLTSLPANVFANQQQLEILELISNPFEENFPSGLFDPLVSLRMLLINNCRQSVVDPGWFASLSNLYLLNMQNNRILELPEDAFAGLENLSILNLNQNFIQQVHANAFRTLGSLAFIFLEENQIDQLPAGVFAPFRAINYVDLRENRIKTVSRDSFGSLANLGTLDLDQNVVNALDDRIFSEAPILYLFYFGNNLCASGFFSNFQGNRDLFMARLSRCFRNFEFTVETDTDNNALYQFHAGPSPGIQLRVLAANEVHIALTPFNFPWSPMLEIIIGAGNNTRSVIRRNQEVDVAVVPTPGILNDGFWTGFRVTWANHIVLVFREGDQFPFLAFTMLDFYNVNFYGLRTPESRASWIIQPVDADDIGVSPAASEL